MNHSYRLVWNEHARHYVPAPETSRARGRKSGSRAARRAAVLLGTALALPAFAQGPLAPDALPTGGQVVAGQATVGQSGSQMTIVQGSDKAILNWTGFDIGRDASVQFQQPSANAAALNRVNASDASRIEGQLSANGQVWLVNPHGIVFGQGSRVDVGSLVASTLDTSDADFLAGRMHFTRSDADGSISNQGQITAADGGLVALLAPTVENDGTITARMGSVVMAAGEQVTIDAGADGLLKVALDPATVQTLIANRQLVVADGGQVVMTGKAADALAGSVVANTGTVQATTLQEKDGRILLLADMQHGEVQAAGTLAANFVETSAARVTLDRDLRVDTAGGQWLIDPIDFTIGDAQAGAIQSSLDTGDVTVSTEAAGSDPGNIHVNADITWSANTLTLRADNDININAVLTASGTSQLTMNTGASGAVKVGFKPGEAQGFAGRVDFPGRSGAGMLNINGSAYYVLNGLGAAGSTTGSDLQGINGALAGHFALGSDIDASATSGWNSGAGFEPIGNLSDRFTGVFDGLGHTVSNLTINRPGTINVGLFGYVDGGTVRNVGVEGGSISGGTTTGGLVGFSLGGSKVANSYSSATVTGNGANTGGLVGYNVGSTVDNSYATGGVTGGNSTGGLVGQNANAGAVVSNSYATGDVSGGTDVGGLVGTNYNGANVIRSYATGDVTGTGNRSGGLIGNNNFGAGVSESYATGSVSGNHVAGGLVGANNNASVTNSYSTGSVGGNDGTGGLVGDNLNGGTVTGSFWNTETSGQSTSAGGSGKTSAEMQQESTYVGWDFDNTWRIQDGSTQPVLRGFQKALTVTALDYSRVYDATAYTGGNGITQSVPGALGGVVSYGGSSQGAINAGSYAITPNVAMTQEELRTWDVTFVDGALTIDPAALTLSTSDVSKVYDGTTSAAGTAVVVPGTQLYGSDTISGGSFAFTDKNVGTGKTVTVSGVTVNDGNSGNNYTVSYVDNTNSSITPAPLTLSTSDVTKTYDGTTSAAGTATAVGGTALYGSDSLSGGSFAFTDKNVGTGKTVTVSGVTVNDGNGGNNYAVSYVDNTNSSITPAPLTVTANDDSKTYDGGPYSGGNGVSYSGFVPGETEAELGGVLTYGGSSQGAVSVGSYAITPSGLTSGNYDITFVDGTLTVNPASLTITGNLIGTVSKTYDGTDEATLAPGNFELTGWVGGDGASVTKTTGTYDNPNAGSGKTVTVTLDASDYSADAGTDLGNYVLPTSISGNVGSIGQASATVTANSATVTYNGAAQSVTGFTASGLVNGENESVLTGVTTSGGTGTNAGTYVHEISGSDGNYALSFVNGSLTIDPAPLQISTSDVNKIYDGTTSAAGSATAVGGTVLYGSDSLSGGSFAYDDKNVGTGKTVTVSGVTVSDGNGGNNYAVSYVDNTNSSITPAPLTVTANDDSKTYDGTAYSGGNGVSYSGFVAGEDESVLGGTLAWGGSSQGAVDVGSYDITPSGLTSSNYDIGYVDGTLQIVEHTAVPQVAQNWLGTQPQSQVQSAAEDDEDAEMACDGTSGTMPHLCVAADHIRVD